MARITFSKSRRVTTNVLRQPPRLNDGLEEGPWQGPKPGVRDRNQRRPQEQGWCHGQCSAGGRTVAIAAANEQQVEPRGQAVPGPHRVGHGKPPAVRSEQHDVAVVATEQQGYAGRILSDDAQICQVAVLVIHEHKIHVARLLA